MDPRVYKFGPPSLSFQLPQPGILSCQHTHMSIIAEISMILASMVMVLRQIEYLSRIKKKKMSVISTKGILISTYIQTRPTSLQYIQGWG